jgi:hypothetical protein
MAINDIVQTIAEARVDARSLSEFMFYPASAMVQRRLAPPINTLNHYLAYLEGLKAVYTQQTGTVTVNGVQVKAVSQAVRDALNSAAIDNNTQVDTLITATPQGVGMVARTQAQVNAETVSLLDFGAPYSTDSTEQLQAAFDYLNSVGGGVLTIPLHTGTLVLGGSVTPYSNITVECADNLIIDCNSSSASNIIVLRGSIGEEFQLTDNATVGDTILKFDARLNVQPLDNLLLVSQRECAHADAGEDWLLGETTANVQSPHFAEVVIASAVLSGQITTQTPLVFPDYRIDKSQETSISARDASTLRKISFKENFKWFGGIFKRDSGNIFSILWTKNCVIKTEFARGYGTGHELSNYYSYNNTIDVVVRRPSDWVMTESHQRYNSVKDISSWYTDITLNEDSGSQGLDQTYSLYPCIFPRYNITATNSKEAAMTTHGNCYGADITVNATNCNNYAYYGRARFTKAKITAMNCKGAVSCSVGGAMDCTYDLHAINMYYVGIRMDSEGTSGKTPTLKNTSISGRIIMSPKAEGSAVWIQANTSTHRSLENSGLILSNLYIKCTDRAISIYEKINGVMFNNIVIDYLGTESPIYLRYNAGHIIGNLNVRMHESSRFAISATPLETAADRVSYGNPSHKIDYATCVVEGLGSLISDDPRTVANKIIFNGSGSKNDLQRVTNKNASEETHITINSGSTGQNRLVLDNSIPLGMVLRFYIDTVDPERSLEVYPPVSPTGSVNFLNGVNDVGVRGITATTLKYFHIQKVAANVFNVY